MGYAIAVLLTVGTVGAVIGSIALRATGRPWRIPLLAIAAALPLHALSLFFVRLPLHGVLAAQLAPDTLFWVSSLYAPLLEEPPKWLVLGALFWAGQLTPARAVGLALAVGLGFGLGEIGTLSAGVFLKAPEQTHFPFYVYSGFFVERLLVCFLHGAFAIAFARALATGRWIWPAALLGLVLHYLVNLPIALASVAAFGIAREVWIGLAMPWLIVMTLALAVYAASVFRTTTQRSLLGDEVCEACHKPFARSLIAINLGPWKLQRCPHCGKWQLV